MSAVAAQRRIRGLWKALRGWCRARSADSAWLFVVAALGLSALVIEGHYRLEVNWNGAKVALEPSFGATDTTPSTASR